jgi:lipoate-protein ligase A
MFYIESISTDPCFNHAIEEYLLKNSQEEFFMLWRSDPCILIGKNQNAFAEINVDYVKANNIKITRRITGGGAVFNDLGNINFTFITNKEKDASIDFEKFAAPIIAALQDLHVDARFSGRNDITIDGKKFSGNAQHVFKNRLLHHGTLLFSGNLTDLSSALKPDPLKFQDKSVKSVASRVTNIGSHLTTPMTVLEFKDFLMQHVMNAYDITQTYQLSQNELAEINKISTEKYASWDWNFGHAPTYSFSNTKKFQGGMVQFNLNIEKGSIKDIKLFGDFFGELDVADLENKLKGIRYTEADVQNALEQEEIQKYLNNITKDEFIAGMFN